MTAKPVGAGSVWNTNSWHWEEKNVTKVFKESLEQRLLELHMPLTFNEQSGAVKVEAVEISGDAAVSVRKKKRIASFEFTVVMAWVSTCAAAQFADCRGKMKIVELAADDVDDDSYALSVTVDCSDEPHRAVKEALRTAGQAAVRRGIRAWATELKSLSDDQQADTERREDELKKMEAADAEKGELKEQMLAEQQSKEEEGYRQAKAERERERQSFEQLPRPDRRPLPRRREGRPRHRGIRLRKLQRQQLRSRLQMRQRGRPAANHQRGGEARRTRNHSPNIEHVCQRFDDEGLTEIVLSVPSAPCDMFYVLVTLCEFSVELMFYFSNAPLIQMSPPFLLCGVVCLLWA
eukprot:Selendium_serpulae@DN4931_c0_g1_i2.p1